MQSNDLVLWALVALAAVLAVLVVGLAQRVERSPGRSPAAPAAATVQPAELAATLDSARAALVGEVGAAVAGVMRDFNNEATARLSDLTSEKLDSRLELSREVVTSNSERVDRHVAAMDQSLQSLRDVVTRLDRERSEQHADLRARLERTAIDQAKLIETTSALGAVLLNPTARGAWGERAAGDLLARAGLVEGVSFRRQTTLESGGRPDFTFVLPGDRHLHMDVKFPADNYMKAIETADDVERSRCEERFIKDVRTCVAGLARRGYADDPAALDHVLLFIPNEAIHQFLHERDPALLTWSMERDVILCAPSSLLGVLGVLRETVEVFHLERRSNEILDVLAGVEEQWTKFCDKMENVGKTLDRLDRAFDELASTRTRGVQRQLDRVAALRTDSVGVDVTVASTPALEGGPAVEASTATTPRVPWSRSVAS